MDADELKQALQRGRARRRYPDEVREATLAYAQRAKRDGKSYQRIAEELGMSVQTLAYWRANAAPQSQLQAMTLVAEQRSAERDVVVEYGALRVRGLDVGGVAELLRRLG